MSEKLFSDIERATISELAQLHNVPLQCPEDGLDFTDFEGMKSVKKVIEERQKAISALKRTINQMKDDRLNAIYAPYKTQRSKEKARKTKLSELHKMIEHTPWYSPFNPTRVLRIANVAPLPDDPQSLGNSTLTSSIEAWKHQATACRLPMESVERLLGAYQEYATKRSDE